jgi:hypothetical protein
MIIKSLFRAALAACLRWLPLFARGACRAPSSQEQPAARHGATWTGRSASVRGTAQRLLRARIAGRPVLENWGQGAGGAPFSAANSVQELIALARKSPGSLKYAPRTTPRSSTCWGCSRRSPVSRCCTFPTGGVALMVQGLVTGHVNGQEEHKPFARRHPSYAFPSPPLVGPSSLTAIQQSAEGIGSQAVGAAREAPADARAGQQLGGAGNAGRRPARPGVTRRTPTHAETAAAYPGSAVPTGLHGRGPGGSRGSGRRRHWGAPRGRQKVLWNSYPSWLCPIPANLLTALPPRGIIPSAGS